MSYCPIDVLCETCEIVFEFDKGSTEKDTPKKIKCPECGGVKTRRVYGFQGFAVGEGNAGNAKTGYSKSIMYHPNSMCPNLKGKKV